ncbi:hypothetical protein [Lacticaseibacillus jixiensis]|uniref:hypothetical protein n=1 Tax=Lacticaseibacillus jixiensis TaxID=3231926 RepID=UPI0036F30AE1
MTERLKVFDWITLIVFAFVMIINAQGVLPEIWTVYASLVAGLYIGGYLLVQAGISQAHSSLLGVGVLCYTLLAFAAQRWPAVTLLNWLSLGGDVVLIGLGVYYGLGQLRHRTGAKPDRQWLLIIGLVMVGGVWDGVLRLLKL